MANIFDPFDERLRSKIKRRRTEEVAAEEKAWKDRVDNHFRRELDFRRWPDYVDSECMSEMIAYNPETNVTIGTIKRNFRGAMERLGYQKYTSENNVRGRWKIDGTWTTVYFKRGVAKVERSQLKQALGD